MQELQEAVSTGRRATRTPDLPPVQFSDPDTCLYEFDAYELWTFTHPNVEHIGRHGAFRIDEWPAETVAPQLDLFQQSEAKHRSHPGRHELTPDGRLQRDYAINALAPAGIVTTARQRERFLIVRSERSAQPAGMVRFIERLSETSLPGNGRAFCLTFEFPFILVRPECRGLAFGAALARARGRACGESIETVSRQLGATPLTVRIRHGELHQLGTRTLQASMEEMESALDRLRTQFAGNPLLLLEPIPCSPMEASCSPMEASCSPMDV